MSTSPIRVDACDASVDGIPAGPARTATRQSKPSGACCKRHDLIVCGPDGIHREELEQLIRSRFAAEHGARVCSFMPTMFAMRNDMGRLCSVAGFRQAVHGPLFLEQYLSEPVERAIRSAGGQHVERSNIVEVGNLAGINCRAAVRLVLQLPQLLLSRGQKWIVFTATGAVRQLLAGYGTPLLDLAPADAARIGRNQDDWGRYYECDPRVMAGYLPHGIGMRRARGMEHG